MVAFDSFQVSNRSYLLLSFYIADMPRTTELVKRVFYVSDLTVWATGVKIPDLEESLNTYLEEILAYLKGNSLLISAPVFNHVAYPRHTPSQDPPEILIEDSQLPPVHCPKILGVYLDTSLSSIRDANYKKHQIYTERGSEAGFPLGVC